MGKLCLIERHVLIGNHFQRQVNGETIGVIQLESIGAGEFSLPFRLMLCKHIRKDGHTAIDCTCKVLFLNLDNLGDIVAALTQIGVVALIFMNDSLNDLIQEGIIDAKELTMASSPAEQTAQDIAAALIAGQNTICDHKGGCTDVVRDNTQRNVHLYALSVGCAGKLCHLVGDVHYSVHIKQGVDILTDNSQTLQTHTGVDILLYKFSVVTVSVVIKLGENVIPDLHVAVAVTTDGTARLAAAVFLATVIVNLRAGTAGTGAMLPEVIFFSKTENTLGRNTYFLIPDFKGFIIIFVDGRIETVLIQPNNLCQELPAPGNCLMLEIVAKGEVAKHLKIGAMTGSFADVLNVTGTNTFLAGTYPMTRRLYLTLKVGLHRCHAGIDQQQRRIILRNQRKAGKAKMPLAFKERQKHLSQFVYTIGFGIHRLSTSK